MIVRRLELDFYRNYPHLEADFSPVTNVIYGENAQGKTNLLEALAYLSTASSHRARYDRELIQFGVDSAFIKGELFSRERDFTLEARLSRTGRKHLFSNGVRLKNAGELSGILNTVLFCPEDLSLIREGAAARRRFLNECICQLRPRYAATLAEYNRLHEHKTRILRDWPEKPSLLDTLDEFSLRMAQTGAILIHYRAHRPLYRAPSLRRGERRGGMKELLRPIAAIALSALVLLGAAAALRPVAERNRAAEREAMMARLLPGGSGFVPEEYTGEDENIRAVYGADAGYVIETVTAGYAGDVTLLVGVGKDGGVTGVVVRDLHETYGLGREALTDTAFLGQFLGTAGEASVGKDIEALTGATVTSKAIAKGVNSAAAFVTGADVSSSATEWGDW